MATGPSDYAFFPGLQQPYPGLYANTFSPFVLPPAPNDTFEYQGQQTSESSAPQSHAESEKQDKPLTTAQKIKSFCNGLISPLTDPFKSPKKFLIAAGLFIGHAVLIGATGGAAAIPLMAIGLATALYQTGKGAYKLSSAETESEKKKAIYDLGAGIANTGLLVLGTKTALKEASHGGIKLSPEEIEKMSAAQAARESFRQLPASMKESYKAVGSGNMWGNTKSFMSRQVTEAKEKVHDTRDKLKASLANKDSQPWPSTIKDIASILLRAISFNSLLGLD